MWNPFKVKYRIKEVDKQDGEGVRFYPQIRVFPLIWNNLGPLRHSHWAIDYPEAIGTINEHKDKSRNRYTCIRCVD